LTTAGVRFQAGGGNAVDPDAKDPGAYALWLQWKFEPPPGNEALKDAWEERRAKALATNGASERKIRPEFRYLGCG
jgi:hypothetical protein